MIDVKQVGVNICKSRKAVNLSPFQLADQLGVNTGRLQEWEDGERLPDLENMLHIAQACRTTVEDLVCNSKSDLSAPSPRRIWEDMLVHIQTEINQSSYLTWFRPATARLEGQTLTIYCKDMFAAEWMYAKYSELIVQTLDKWLGKEQIKVVIRSKSDSHYIDLESALMGRVVICRSAIE